MPAVSKKEAVVKKAAQKTALKNTKAQKPGTAYDEVKLYDGHQYTGMPVGRSHKWYYDKGDWRETKITPDLWEISYNVTKRRAGHAPEGTGVPIGTEYQWYILAHQNVRKLNEDDYTTELTGLKFKLAHKRADKNKWSITGTTQRKKLVKLLQEMIADLEREPIKFDLEYKDAVLKIEATAISQTCHEGMCTEYEIAVDNRHIGIIKKRKTGWKMDNAPDPKLINIIGKEVEKFEK